MKKIILLFAFSVVLLSCKNKEENKEISEETVVEEASEVKTFRGDFLYVADAAVLQGNDFIYGVTLDEMTEVLADRVAAAKKQDFDMVPVVVKGYINPKEEGQEGWEEILTITEIVSVSKTASPADVQIEEKKN